MVRVLHQCCATLHATSQLLPELCVTVAIPCALHRHLPFRSTWRSSSRHPKLQRRRRWPGRVGSPKSLAGGLGLGQLPMMTTRWLPGSASRRQRQPGRRLPKQVPRHLRKERCLASRATQRPWRQRRQQPRRRRRLQPKQQQRSITIRWQQPPSCRVQARRGRAAWTSSGRRQRRLVLSLIPTAATCGTRHRATITMQTQVWAGAGAMLGTRSGADSWVLLPFLGDASCRTGTGSLLGSEPQVAQAAALTPASSRPTATRRPVLPPHAAAVGQLRFRERAVHPPRCSGRCGSHCRRCGTWF